MPNKFVVKTTDDVKEFPSGMHRGGNSGKTNYALIHIPFLKRIAEHLTKGAAIYGKGNWKKANSEEEHERFRESAFRHFIQWFDGEDDEDHMAAVCFNLMAAEYVKAKFGTTPDNHEEYIDEKPQYVTVFWSSGKISVMTEGAMMLLNPIIRNQIISYTPGRICLYTIEKE